MGNLTLGNSQKDQIPGRGILHPNGVLLGGWASLNPDRKSSLHLLMDKASMETVPWTVREGAVAPVSMSIFGQINDASARAPSDRYLGFDPGGMPE